MHEYWELPRVFGICKLLVYSFGARHVAIMYMYVYPCERTGSAVNYNSMVSINHRLKDKVVHKRLWYLLNYVGGDKPAYSLYFRRVSPISLAATLSSGSHESYSGP